MASTITAPQAMRAVSSMAAATSGTGSAMMARSAWICIRSASVPLVCVLMNCSVPAKRWALSACSSASACGVLASSPDVLPAKTTMLRGAKSGAR
jgi:hypothetical protein